METIKIKDITKDKKGHYGIGASAENYVPTHPEYLRITDITDYGDISSNLPCTINPIIYPDWNKYQLKSNDIVFARTGNSTGRNYFCKNMINPTVFAGFLIKFSLDPNLINPQYVGYYCQSKAYWNQIKSLFTGSTRSNVNAEQYGNLNIPIVSSSLQQHIVDTIGTVDDLIEKEQEIFKQIGALGLKIFSKYESCNSSLLKETFDTFNGYTFKSKSYVIYSKNKLITIKNIDDIGFNTSSVSFLDDKHIDPKFKLSIGDILLTMTGNIGRIGIVDEDYCYLNQRVLKINCFSKLYCWCYLKKYKNKIIELGKGTAQVNLSLEEFQNLVLKNSSDEIKSFSKYDFIYDEMVSLKIKIKNLKAIKDNLLAKYF